MAVPHLMKLVLHWSGHGEEGATSMHFVPVADYTEDALYAAIGNIDDQWGDDTVVDPTVWEVLQGWLDPGQAYDDLAIYQYPSGSGPASIIAHRAPQTARPGTGTAVACLQQSFVATLRGDLSGRRRRGRQYWPGHTRVVDSSVQMTQTAIDQLADYAALAPGVASSALYESLGGASAPLWVVYSPTGGISTEITSCTVDSRLDVQRRRAASQVALRTAVQDVEQ